MGSSCKFDRKSDHLEILTKNRITFKISQKQIIFKISQKFDHLQYATKPAHFRKFTKNSVHPQALTKNWICELGKNRTISI